MDQEIMVMTNIISLEEGLKLRLQKHLDLAEIWLETGDRVAYEDHMKIAESIFSQLEEYELHKINS